MGITMDKEELIFSTGEEKIVKFFKKLSDAMGVYICSYDNYGQIINDFTGNEEEREILDKYIHANLRHEMFGRLTIDSIEDQIIEDTASPYIKVGATALKFEGQCKEVWFIAGVLYEDIDTLSDELNVFTKKISKERFVKIIDSMREIGQYRVGMELSLAMYEEKQRKSLFSVNEMAESLKRVETLTKILRYLDSDKNIEAIMKEFLEITADYLGVGEADIFKTKEQPGFTMDILAGYTANSGIVPYDRTVDIIKFPFLEGKKPIILSAGATAINAMREQWPKLNAKAVVAMPVTIGHQTNMYAVYTETKIERNWRIEDLQFLSDAIKVLQNIIEKRIQKNSLAGSYASLEQILEHVGCAIIVNDIKKQEVLFQNEHMKKMFPLDELDTEMYEIIWEERHEEREEIEFYDHMAGKWYEIHHSNITWVDGRPVALYAIYEVTEKKNYQKRIEQQAYTDFLTGLFNRMCCERDLARIVDEAKKTGETGVLLYLDLDDFKHINDSLGHQYGDVLLKGIGQAIKSIEGIEDTCYRIGGDEFVIIIPPRSYKSYNEILSNVKSVFARPWYLKDGDHYCTVSMGTVTFPDEGASVEELIKKADIAMYSVKKTGKNRVAKYDLGLFASSGSSESDE